MTDAALRRLVAGADVPGVDATLAGHSVNRGAGASVAVLVSAPGGQVEGLLCDLGPDAAGRTDWMLRVMGLTPRAVTVAGPDGPVAATVHMGAGTGAGDEPWDAAEWAADRADMVFQAVALLMPAMAVAPAEDMARCWPMYLSRGAATLRAAAMPAPTLASARRIGSVEVEARRVAHAGFFMTLDETLRHPTFAGGMSGPLSREIFLAGDAAIVLPYDPVRDRVLIVEQFRLGPFGRGAAYPWSLEPVAGMVDGGETPEAAARRETEEEAGLVLSDLVHVHDYYPSPGGETGFFYTYVGLCDLPDGFGTAEGGLDDEGEDIRTHVLDFARAMELVETGEAQTGPLIQLLLWLERERPRLRRMA